MNTLELFGDIKETFCSLWKYKLRGETMEVITPFTTPNSKFVSVFITRRNDSYIVTDGGWLLAGEYYNAESVNQKDINPLLKYFEALYELKTIDHYGTKMFFSSTEEVKMIPNKVHDLSQFISQAVSSYALKINDERELKESESFKFDADQFIRGIVGTEKIAKRHSVSTEYDAVRFNVIIEYGSEISLVKYITGSTPHYYKTSLTNAQADFNIINKSPFNTVIKNRIAIINDSAPGYDSKKGSLYTGLLEEYLKRPAVLWSQREKLYELL